LVGNSSEDKISDSQCEQQIETPPQKGSVGKSFVVTQTFGSDTTAARTGSESARASDGVQTSRRLCGYDDRLIVAPVVARQNCGQHQGTSVTIPDNSTTEFVRALLMTYPAIAFSGLDSSFWAFARAVGNGGDTFTGPMHAGLHLDQIEANRARF
jgi:hypothetical protein